MVMSFLLILVWFYYQEFEYQKRRFSFRPLISPTGMAVSLVLVCFVFPADFIVASLPRILISFLLFSSWLPYQELEYPTRLPLVLSPTGTAASGNENVKTVFILPYRESEYPTRFPFVLSPSSTAVFIGLPLLATNGTVNRV
jgi:hypothetical protein